MTFVLALLSIYLFIVLLMYLLQSRLVYFPSRTLVATPADAGLAFQDVRLVTKDGVTLSAWYVPAEAARGTVLFCHGNGGNISYLVESIGQYHGLGLNVLVFDYRGYGESGGSPDEQGTYLDAEAAWTHLVDGLGTSPGNVVVIGRSLGGAVAAWLAGRHKPAALVLESAFTSLPDIGAHAYPLFPVRLLARFRYDTAAHLRTVTCPVLFVHSTGDEIVPFDHSQTLYEGYAGPKTFLKVHGGHNEWSFLSSHPYLTELDRFISQHLHESQ